MNLRNPIIICTFALVLTGCAARKYRSAPISPAESASALDARRLDDPGLKAFLEKSLQRRFEPWPPKTWDLEMLTAAAFYFHPDLDIARARVGAAGAAITTAGARPNPSVSVAPGVSNPAKSPWLLFFDFDLPIETAGKRGYRIARAQHLNEAARLQLGEAAWVIGQITKRPTGEAGVRYV